MVIKGQTEKKRDVEALLLFSQLIAHTHALIYFL
jgi:hypothetical protein